MPLACGLSKSKGQSYLTNLSPFSHQHAMELLTFILDGNSWLPPLSINKIILWVF